MTDNVLRSVAELREQVREGRLMGHLVQEVDFSKAGLTELQLNDVTFKRVGLQGADARGLDCARVKVTESSGRGVQFSEGLFRGCSFFGSELIEARFDGSLMNGTSFYSSRLGNADFSGSRIQSGVFNGCELFGVRFSRSLVINTRFEAQDRGNVTLDRADFSNAVLIDCDMLGANLFGANFDGAVLVKVDLRHANLAQASFNGAKLIDVRVDLHALEPAERRAIEAARIEDPWQQHGFLVETLEKHDSHELRLMLEYVLRTYVIEGAQPSTSADTMAGLVAGLKARHDFPELDALRVRGTVVQVRHGHEWYDLGAPIVGSVGSGSRLTPADDDEPAPAPRAPASPAAAPARSPAGAPVASVPRPAPLADEPAPVREEPKSLKRSKRFRKLDMD